MKTIKIIIKSVYGKDMVYPNCEDSKTFCDMLGRKTLTERDLSYIRVLGYQFEVTTPTLTYTAA